MRCSAYNAEGELPGCDLLEKRSKHIGGDEFRVPNKLSTIMMNFYGANNAVVEGIKF